MKKDSTSNFKSNIIKLILGTGFAQVIPIMLLPVLTRIYSPEDFGIFAVYMAIAGILGVIATGRYELAIVLPKNNNDASDIFWLCIIISFFLSVFSLLFIFMFNDVFLVVLQLPINSNILFLVPFSIFFAGLLQSLNYFFVRGELFGILSKSKVALSGGTISSQTFGGLLFVSSGFGLSIGYIAGQLTSISYLFFNSKKFLKVLKPSIKNIKEQFINYKKFILLSTPGALLDTSAVQLPVFLINSFYSTSIAGQFSLAMRIINLPLALIGAAVSQVLLQKVASSDSVSPENIRPLILKLAFLLAILISPLFVICFFFGEDLFVFIFGPEWVIAGGFAFPISLIVSFRFIVSPLSSVLSLERNIKFAAIWQFLYFLSTLIMLVFATQFTINTFLIIFVVNEFIMYAFYFFLILKGSNSYKPLNNEN